MFKSSVTLISLTLLCFLTVTGCSDDEEAVRPSLFRTVHVPGNHSTIQAAIDAAEGGDTVLVADGIYGGPGNRDLEVFNKILVIMSENGPDATIIECGGTSEDPHYGFVYEQVGSRGSRLIGFTIRNAYSNEGSAVRLTQSSPEIIDCVFLNNHSTVSGGAIKVKSSSPLILNCSFVGNSCSSGAAIFGLAGSVPEIEKCLFAYNTGSHAFWANESTSRFKLSCTNVFGNSSGDFVGDIKSLENTENNFSLDPLLCDQQTDLHLQASSPCAPENSSCGELVGALGVGCIDIP